MGVGTGSHPIAMIEGVRMPVMIGGARVPATDGCSKNVP
jgi:hypothetical protein